MMECKCCKECDKRYIGCHAHCDEYRYFRKAKDKENEIIRTEREKERKKRRKRW